MRTRGARADWRRYAPTKLTGDRHCDSQGRCVWDDDYISRKGSSAASLAVCDRKFESVTPTSRTPFGGGNHGDVRLDDRKFGILRRATASRLAPNRIYKPQRGLNDISVLSKSCHRPSLSGNKAVIWRMSSDLSSRLEEDPRVVIGTNRDRLKMGAFGVFLQGWATSASGAIGAGLDDMRQAVDGLRAQSVVLFTSATHDGERAGQARWRVGRREPGRHASIRTEPRAFVQN